MTFVPAFLNDMDKNRKPAAKKQPEMRLLEKHGKSKKKSSKAPKSYRWMAWALVIALSFLCGYFVGHSAGVTDNHKRLNILIVNEKHPLSPDYTPDNLVNIYEMRHSYRCGSTNIYLAYECYSAAQEMFYAAEQENVNGFIINSGYRSYADQQKIFASKEEGYAQKPGCSEHQTGLCFDVTAENVGGFEKTEQYAWLYKNAHKYGFIQRYPSNKADITGIKTEPWHYRYVGIEAATYMHNNNLTLEEYLGEA